MTGKQEVTDSFLLADNTRRTRPAWNLGCGI